MSRKRYKWKVGRSTERKHVQKITLSRPVFIPIRILFETLRTGQQRVWLNMSGNWKRKKCFLLIYPRKFWTHKRPMKYFLCCWDNVFILVQNKSALNHRRERLYSCLNSGKFKITADKMLYGEMFYVCRFKAYFLHY